MSAFNNSTDNSQVVYEFSNKQTKGAFLTKVFGVMFLLLLLATAIAAGLGFGSQYLLMQALEAGNTELANNIVYGLVGTTIVSAIALLVMSFVLPITFARGRHNILVPLIIYTVLVGLLLSSFTYAFDWVILVESLGITTIIFGVMALLGYVSKGRLTGIGYILSGLFVGAILLSLMNSLMILIGGISKENVTISWIVSLAFFAFLMLVTLYDVNRIKRIAENGAVGDNNLVYYCSFILFTDFIAILVRVIYYLAALKDR